MRHGITDTNPADNATPAYTLRYTRNGEPVTRRGLTAAGVETVGAVVMRVASRRGDITEIAVLNEAGVDVTFDFACFGDLDDFEPVREGLSLAAVHRQWLDRGLPARTWPAYVARWREANRG